MKRTNVLLFLLLFSIVIFANSSNVYSQPKKDRNPKSKERIDMVKKMKLLEVLNLSEDESDKFLSKYTTYEKKSDEKFEAMKIATNDLEQAIDKKSSDIKAKVDKVVTLQEELNTLMIEKQKSMKSVLNDENYAKYILFEHTFFRKLNNALIECKGDGPRSRDKNKKNNRSNK